VLFLFSQLVDEPSIDHESLTLISLAAAGNECRFKDDKSCPGFQQCLCPCRDVLVVLFAHSTRSLGDNLAALVLDQAGFSQAALRHCPATFEDLALAALLHGLLLCGLLLHGLLLHGFLIHVLHSCVCLANQAAGHAGTNKCLTEQCQPRPLNF
jgi:hypothetical protein